MAIFLIFYGISLIFSTHTDKRAFRLRRNYLRLLCLPILNIKVELTGKHIDKPALYVANHRSFSDPAIICRFIEAFVIAKAEVAKLPVLNIGAKATGVLYVDRENQSSRNAAREAMINHIKAGRSILVFPEGTVGAQQYTKAFKTGTFREAAKNNIPVVPVTLEYQSDLDMWESRSLVSQYFRQFSKWTTYTKMHISAPILLNDPEQHAALVAQEEIDKQMKEMQNGWSLAF